MRARECMRALAQRECEHCWGACVRQVLHLFAHACTSPVPHPGSDTADALCACVRACWCARMRLSDGRYFLGQWRQSTCC
jgi:hypothetical protein